MNTILYKVLKKRPFNYHTLVLNKNVSNVNLFILMRTINLQKV